MTHHRYPGRLPDPDDSWQGQATQYAQSDQDTGAHTWHDQSMYPGQHPPQKPVFRQWWFLTIIVIIALGLVAIALVLAARVTVDDGSGALPGDDGGFMPAPVEDSETGPDMSGIQRSEDGVFSLPQSGTGEAALDTTQDRLDAGYSTYGPAELVALLRYDGYDNTAIEYALNHVEVDWEQQALGTAQRHADNVYSGSSAQELRDYLAFAGFIATEIDYALDQVEIDYNEQAVASLQYYRNIFSDLPDAELREHLIRAGFADTEIAYAFEHLDTSD